MNTISLLNLITEIANLILALAFFCFFTIRTLKLHRLSESNRFIHLYPYKRGIFVLIFVLVNCCQYVIYFKQKCQDSDLNQIQLFYIIGTSINSIILILELYVLRIEILKQKPITPLHRIYWLYLPIINFLRLIELFSENQLNSIKFQLILSFVIAFDSLFLCIYSLVLKKQQIEEFQNYSMFKFYNLSVALRQTSLLSQLQNLQRQGYEDNTLIRVEVIRESEKEFILKIFRKYEHYVNKTCTLQEIVRLYRQTEHFHLKSKLELNQQVKLNSIQKYFDELMSDWAYYENFVLDFLNISKDRQFFIQQQRKQHLKKQTDQQFQEQDINALYFNIKITQVKRTHDHYNFQIEISPTASLSHKKQIFKRYNEILELDRKLHDLVLDLGFKLALPEFPSKLFFLREGDDILNQRKDKLELYLRRIANDKIFIKKYRQVRGIIFEFFGYDHQEISLEGTLNNNLQYNSNLTCEKGHIENKINEHKELSTYYSFIIKDNGIKVREIYKRYKQFTRLHDQIKRWMQNTQIQYKFLHLPPKKLKLNMTQKQKINRHTELNLYLNRVLKQIPNIFDCYEVRTFLELKSHKISNRKSTKSQRVVNLIQNELNESKISEGETESARISNLIEKLGVQINLPTL